MPGEINPSFEPLDDAERCALKAAVEAAKSSQMTAETLRSALASLGVIPEFYHPALKGDPVDPENRRALLTVAYEPEVLATAFAEHGWRPVDPIAIREFIDAVFRYASDGVMISLNVIEENKGQPRIQKHRFESLEALTTAAHVTAQGAADHGEPAVFCAPLVGFASGEGTSGQSREQDVAEAYAISVECDQAPNAARARLEALLGPATVIVASGGEWNNPETGEIELRLHLHWRLTEPATAGDLNRLKRARKLATLLVGADASNVPVVHPMRLPGSWHRKGTPRIARSVSLNAQVELDLTDALDRLGMAAGAFEDNESPVVRSVLTPPSDFGDLARKLLAGEELHDSILRMAAKFVGCGMHDGAAVISIRSLMMQTPEQARDARWQARFDDIPRAVSSARDRFGSATRQENPTVAPAPDDRNQELPDHLTHVPGLVGDIVNWLTDTARQPHRGLALGAALAVVGTAAGQTYAGPTNSGTHLYVLALAPTGAGKNHAAKMASRLMEHAGLSEHIGPGQYMSLGSVMRDLSDQPRKLAFMDEFGGQLGRMTAARSSAHEKAVKDILRTAWGSSFETLRPPVYADASRKLRNIESPALSIYGMSTPEEFFRALSGDDVFNGFLNRFLILPSDLTPPDREPSVSEFQPPEDLAARLKGLSLPRRGAISQQLRPGGPAVRVSWVSEASQAYLDLKAEIAARDTDRELLSRAAEIIIRLATIRAIGCDPDHPVIRREDVEWARELTFWSMDRMIVLARDFIADTDHQRLTSQVRRLIKAAKGQISHSGLIRKMQHTIPAKRVREIIEGLEQSGEVTASGVSTGGREGRVYVLQD